MHLKMTSSLPAKPTSSKLLHGMHCYRVLRRSGRQKILRACMLLSVTATLISGYARILATTSVESQEAPPGYLPYNAAKWSLMALQVHIPTPSLLNRDMWRQSCLCAVNLRSIRLIEFQAMHWSVLHAAMMPLGTDSFHRMQAKHQGCCHVSHVCW